MSMCVCVSTLKGMKLLDSISDSTEINLVKLWEREKGRTGMLQSFGSQRVEQDLVAKQQQCVCVPESLYYMLETDTKL